MFFNFAALFHHYGSFHPGFSGIYMCLYDGTIFDSFASLEEHVSIHESNMVVKHGTFKQERNAKA
jgi:hypothetical protein